MRKYMVAAAIFTVIVLPGILPAMMVLATKLYLPVPLTRTVIVQDMEKQNEEV